MSTDTFEFLATDVPVLESDTYAAALEHMELRQSKTTFVRDDGTAAPDEYYSWKFRLLGDEHEEEYVFANSSTSFGRKSKMRKWVSAILNREIQTGDRLTTTDLLGVPCRLVVKKERDNEGVWGNKVTDILPAAPKAPAAQSPSKNGMGPKPVPTLEELFEDGADAGPSDKDKAADVAGLIRRFEIAKKKLGWNRAAYDTWGKRAMGWTDQQIADRPASPRSRRWLPACNARLWRHSRRPPSRPMHTTKRADVTFNTDPDAEPSAPSGDEGEEEN